jgi:lactoylglutathione lyase
MITRIATVAVYVEDQDKAEEFWTRQVGFEVKRRDKMGPQASWLEIGPRGGTTNLVIYPRSMMRDWREMKPSLVFGCDDFEATYENLKGNGVEFLEEPKKMPWGTYAQFRDLDGNVFLLKG